MFSPTENPDQEDRASDAAFPRRLAWDTVGGRQPPRTEFHAFSLARRRVDPAVPSDFGYSGCSRPQGTVLGRFPTSHLGRHGESRYRHAAFMAFFYDLYALVGNLRFSEVRVRAATLLGSGNHDAPKRSSVPLPFAVLRFIYRPGAAGLWPPRHPHPHPPPRGSGVRTELESRPGGRTVQT